MKIFPRKTIHLDYASTTPLDSEVFECMKPYFTQEFYNPSALYDGAREVKSILEKSRSHVARYLGCREDEVIFTSGGTESSNIGIRGVLQATWSEDPRRVPHVVTTEFEHPATLELCIFLEKKGWITMTLIKPNEFGVITPEAIEQALIQETVLVSCIHVHNETGIIQPIRGISRKIQKIRKEKDQKSIYPVFHVDASQSPCYIKVQKESLGADLITLDAAKFYGPKGVGVLFVKGNVPLEAVYHGGGQEKGIRPGTENIPGIVGFAQALLLAEQKREEESVRIRELNDFFCKEIKENFPEAHIHGFNQERSPHIINICFPNVDSEFLTIKLASEGVNVSFMTACKTAGEESISQSIQSFDPKCSGSSIRFSFGRKTTKKEVKKAIKILKKRVS